MKKQILGLLVVIAILFILGCEGIPCSDKVCPSCEVCPEQKECPECKSSQIPKNTAIMDLYMRGHYQNENDLEEFFFKYDVLNYGDAEAKDIQITCKLYDAKEDLVLIQKDSVGNIASHSTRLEETKISKSKNIDPKKEYIPFCYVQSCENCVILHERIPTYAEYTR